MTLTIKQQWNEMTAALAESGLSQAEIAYAAGVSQPAVSRLMSRAPVRSGRAFKKICIYALESRQSMHQRRAAGIKDASLIAAIQEVWNGTPEHAQALAAMIRAAGAAARIAMS